MNKRIQNLLVSVVVGLLFIVLAVSVFITIKNNRDHMIILNESVKSNLISISIAARELIDVERFYLYNSMESMEADGEAYFQVLENLRSLHEMVGATYIYALKQINGKYYFIFDTDPEVETIVDIFTEYDDISEIHLDAFDGKYLAGIMNVVDQWGSYNTGAIPIWKGEKVIGIVSVDIEDYFIRASQQAAVRNIIILVILLTVVMGANIVLIHRIVMKPLSQLTDSVSKPNISISSIYGKDRADEIGELSRKIYTMTGKLEIAIEKAQTASRAKSSFLANMSHEIRTPMNAIIGMTNIAKSTNSIERKEYALKKIEEASNHLLDIINDILDMSKIEANKLELNSEAFDFEEMLKKTINIINFRIVEKKQKFAVYIDEKIPHTLICDDKRLSQVITNLLSNAVKFTPENGAINLSVDLLKDENNICKIQFSIVDTGVGISEEHQTRLFNPFEQAESSTTRKYGGTGLGLALTKRIVELMGGTISVVSALGKGSAFTFTIKAEKAIEEVSNMAPANGINVGNIRILIVDDDRDILEYFVDIAMRFNMTCDTAASGEEALALIKKGNLYDICFVDWMMPGMDGIELSRQIRENYTTELVIIMISSFEWQQIKTQAKDAGLTRFLPKPIFPSDFIACINKCFGIDLLSKGYAGESEKIDSFWGYRALLVEDIEINREIVIALLEPTLLEIDCAENGAEALRMFSEAPEKYNIIFMDLQMPKMDGYEATRNIRALDNEKSKTIPIIAMTANVFKEDVENCLAAGMNGHVGKPLDFVIVLNILRQYLFTQKPAKERRKDDRRKTKEMGRRQMPDRRQNNRRKND
ncbi:MAG: response regulator [Spirochaetaceae bacterium]|nr:response regulator [Spirochaetaceae bacterium]